MNTLGPGMGPGSKMDLSQQLRELKPTQPRELKPDQGLKLHDLGGQKGFSDLVRERTPVRPDAVSKLQDAKREKSDELRPDDRQNDSRPVKVESKGKSSKQAGETGAEKADVRKKAMLKFMDSMENEFGITPARMLEAMANIDSEELTLAPEDTASQVIENLDLPSEDQPQAMALYSSFINQWRELQDNSVPTPVATSESMPIVAAGAGGFFASGEALGKLGAKGLDAKSASGQIALPAGMESLSPQQASQLEAALKARSELATLGGETPVVPEIPLSAGEKRAMLNDSLDQMNARFFAKPELKLAEALPSAQVLPANLMTQDAMAAQAAVENMPVFTQDDSGLYAGKAFGESQLNFAALPGMMPGKAELGADFVGAKAATSSEGSSALAALMAEVQSAANQGESSESGDLGSETGSDAGSMDQNTQDLSRTDLARGDFGQLFKPVGLQGSAAAAAGTSLTADAMTATDHKEALEALKDQTQIMVDKGGGEAKITFNQEGLGEISLKVTVREGKVNVEMGAETQEAKKLIESSIGELKASLSQHKLAVEGVRVDVGSSGLSDNKQSGMNFGQDMGRDQARQMMQQFRDETSGRRDPFFEMSGIRAYGKKMPGPAPIAAAPDRVINRYTGQGRGDRMNLVG